MTCTESRTSEDDTEYSLTHESIHGLVAVILKPRDFASLHLLRCSRLTLGWHAVGIALPIVIPLRRSTWLLSHGPLPLLSRPLLLVHDLRVSKHLAGIMLFGMTFAQKTIVVESNTNLDSKTYARFCTWL